MIVKWNKKQLAEKEGLKELLPIAQKQKIGVTNVRPITRSWFYKRSNTRIYPVGGAQCSHFFQNLTMGNY